MLFACDKPALPSVLRVHTEEALACCSLFTSCGRPISEKASDCRRGDKASVVSSTLPLYIMFVVYSALTSSKLFVICLMSRLNCIKDIRYSA
jgi:hypothetical protein